MKRIRNQLSQILLGQGCQNDLMHDRSSLANRLELAHQRMGRSHLVVSIGADQHQVLHARLGRQIFEQVETGWVEPLQIVQKQRQRMFWSGKDIDETPENELETALSVLRCKFWDWGLAPKDQPHLRDEVGDELTVLA